MYYFSPRLGGSIAQPPAAADLQHRLIEDKRKETTSTADFKQRAGHGPTGTLLAQQAPLQGKRLTTSSHIMSHHLITSPNSCRSPLHFIWWYYWRAIQGAVIKGAKQHNEHVDMHTKLRRNAAWTLEVTASSKKVWSSQCLRQQCGQNVDNTWDTEKH